jgi:hypothetical protein
MRLDQTFNIDEMPEGNSFEPLPAGWYPVEIVSAEVKVTKAGTGQYVAVGYRVTDSAFSGRMIFGNLNIRNPNVTAEEIGQQQLGEIMRAGGLKSLGDTDLMIGINCEVQLVIKDDPQYGPRNEIKKIRGRSGAAAKPQMATASSGKPSPPWAKK